MEDVQKLGEKRSGQGCMAELRGFILRHEVIKLYRLFTRTLREAPPDARSKLNSNLNLNLNSNSDVDLNLGFGSKVLLDLLVIFKTSTRFQRL